MLEILLEEPSAESALRILVPRLVPYAEEHVNFALRVFRGKDDLLRKLPDRLCGYASWARHTDVRILALVDRDDDDYIALKNKMDSLAAEAGLTVHRKNSVSVGGSFKARIACEEIEAWFLGDPDALRRAYPRVAKNFEHRAGFRDVDNIHGGTWEKLQKILQDAGYFRTASGRLSWPERWRRSWTWRVTDPRAFATSAKLSGTFSRRLRRAGRGRFFPGPTPTARAW